MPYLINKICCIIQFSKIQQTVTMQNNRKTKIKQNQTNTKTKNMQNNTMNALIQIYNKFSKIITKIKK